MYFIDPPFLFLQSFFFTLNMFPYYRMNQCFITPCSIVLQTNLQLNVLACVAAIIETGNADCQCISFDLFLIILSVIGLHRKDFVKEQVYIVNIF